MKNKALEKLKWKIAEGFGIAPSFPGDILPSMPDLVDWFKPRGVAIKGKRRAKKLTSRGGGIFLPKRVDRLYYRGSRLHHEAAARRVRKAYLSYRGKGAKVERRSARSRARRGLA